MPKYHSNKYIINTYIYSEPWHIEDIITWFMWVFKKGVGWYPVKGMHKIFITEHITKREREKERKRTSKKERKEKKEREEEEGREEERRI